jgi:hypothetical protein
MMGPGNPRKKITRSGDASDRMLNAASHVLCDEAIA